jgi:MFS family permease
MTHRRHGQADRDERLNTIAENPEDVASQEPLTVEADIEVPPAAIVRRTWIAHTFASFQSRDFTLFWAGALVSNTGSWMQNAALAIVVFSFQPDPGHASFNSGIVAGVSGIPVLFLAIPAGAIADRFDRRKLLIWIQVVLLIQAVALGLLYDSHVLGPARPIWSLALVSLLGLVGGIFIAFQGPAFQSLLPDLVPRGSLMNGIALNSAQFQSSRMIGPMIVAGMVLLGAGMGLVFYANALSFLFVIAALLAIRPRAGSASDIAARRPAAGSPGAAAARGGARAGNGDTAAGSVGAQGGPKRSAEGTWKTLMAGISYARENRGVGLLIASTALLTVLGFPYMTLLTAIVKGALGGTDAHVARVYSTIAAFNGFGALIGALGVASLPHSVRRNRIIPFSLLTFAAMIIAFSLVRSELMMIVFSTLAGIALMATNSLALTSIQSVVPRHLRGRVMALFIMSFMGIMPVSAFMFGPLGQAIGPDAAVLLGGVLLFAWALLLVARPSWLSSHGPTPVDAEA